MAKVIVPTPLRAYAGKQASVDLSAATVGELLEKLTREYSDLRRHLYTDDGKLRSFVNVYLNDEDIRYLEKENTAVKESDVVSIVPSIAGGAHSPWQGPRGWTFLSVCVLANPAAPAAGNAVAGPLDSARGRPPGSA